MGLPKITINQGSGNLGRTTDSEDGISLLIATGVAVGGEFALNDLLGPFTSLADAEALGIDEAYDLANTCLVWHHIKDFYEESEGLGVMGTELYVQVVAKTVRLATMADNTSVLYAKKLLQQLGGKVRLLALSMVPDGAYVPAYDSQIEVDCVSAIAAAQTLWAAEQVLHRPIQILIEGRNWQGTPATSKDLRTLAANRVSVVLSQDGADAAVHASAAKYAHVGRVLGRLAAIAVQRNIGRVKDGPVDVTTPAFSNGGSLNSLTDANLDTMHDRGYIFLRSYVGKDGVYYTDQPTCIVATNDYAWIADGRVIDKVDRLAYQVYVDELLDSVPVDPVTGKLPAAVIKNFQGLVEKKINQNMSGEISSVSAYCDPDQDVLSTSQISIELTIVPMGTARQFVVELAFSNPAN